MSWPTVVPAAGAIVIDAGSATSRLSPPVPMTNVDGWPLEKLMAWKSCTWPCITRSMPGGKYAVGYAAAMTESRPGLPPVTGVPAV